MNEVDILFTVIFFLLATSIFQLGMVVESIRNKWLLRRCCCDDTMIVCDHKSPTPTHILNNKVKE